MRWFVLFQRLSESLCSLLEIFFKFLQFIRIRFMNCCPIRHPNCVFLLLFGNPNFRGGGVKPVGTKSQMLPLTDSKNTPLVVYLNKHIYHHYHHNHHLLQGVFFTGPPPKMCKYRKLLGVSRMIYVNVDSPNLGFPYFNFLGEAQCRKHPVSSSTSSSSLQTTTTTIIATWSKFKFKLIFNKFIYQNNY